MAVPQQDPAVRLRAALETIRVLAQPNAAERLAEAEETIVQLRQALKRPAGKFYENLDCTPEEGVALETLLRTIGACSRLRMLDCLNLAFPRPDGHSGGALATLICKLRLRLSRHRIEIETVSGRGWSMDAANKAKVKALERMA